MHHGFRATGPTTTSTLSTYAGYKLYANNYQKSLLRTAAEPIVASDQAYYNANIGKVTSVDGFLNNYRLFNYAMKANGLSDLGDAKGLMKKVLESDLTDPGSFARRLNDKRYLAFAQSYRFLSNGSTTTTDPAQTAGQRLDFLNRLGADTDTNARVGAALDKVTSIADLESNTTLYNEVLTAYGIKAGSVVTSAVTAALESNLSDPGSAANRKGNTALLAMARDFDFSTTGGIGAQHLLQSPGNVSATETAYLATAGSSDAAQSAARTETTYYDGKIATLTSVDQLLSDKRLVAYVKTAFGLDPAMTTSTLRAVLTSNALDAKSTANTYGVGTTASTSTTPTNQQLVASAFSIGTDGAARDHSAVMSATSLGAAVAAYTAAAKTNKTDQATQNKATATFDAAVISSKSVDPLLSNSDIVSYIQTAFGLPNATTSDLRAILTSNLLDPGSVASKEGGAARTLAAAFNFTPSGLVYAQLPIQSAANQTTTTTAYMAQAKSDAGSQAAAKTETDYFTTSMARVKSLDDILGDKRLVAYLETAYAIPTSTPLTKLRQALTSNLASAKGLANTLGGGFVTMAASFDIAPDGSVVPAAQHQVQTRAGIVATNNAYLEQQMETESAQSDPGVQLALYFRAKAPTIGTAFDILADKALTKVVQTILGLPADSSKADIDSQARTISTKLKLTDLKNPAKLDNLIARFSVLYDITNDPGGNTSITALFGSDDASDS